MIFVFRNNHKLRCLCCHHGTLIAELFLLSSSGDCCILMPSLCLSFPAVSRAVETARLGSPWITVLPRRGDSLTCNDSLNPAAALI